MGAGLGGVSVVPSIMEGRDCSLQGLDFDWGRIKLYERGRLALVSTTLITTFNSVSALSVAINRAGSLTASAPTAGALRPMNGIGNPTPKAQEEAGRQLSC
jgi:hypothetical protein